MPQDTTDEMDFYESEMEAPEETQEPERKDASDPFDCGLGSFEMDMGLAPSF